MDSSEIQKFAKVVVDYSMDIQPKDKLCIQASIPSLPLVKEVYKLAVQRGAYPYVDIVIDELNELYCLHASDEQLEYVSALKEFKVQHCDAFLIILGSENTNSMAGVDPQKIAKRTLSRKKVNEIYMRRISDGSLKLCITQFPNYALAQAAGMSLMGYSEFLSQACFLNEEDPVELWKNYSARQAKISSFLETKKNFRFVSEGTDLHFSAAGRRWINCDGRINFPDGEVFTGPVEDSVNGEITFSFPAVYQGREVQGVYLKFQDGKVIDFDAKHGRETLESMLNTDEGARRAGEIAIATNYNISKFTKNILFDEKIGGTIHLAIGSSIPSSGGVNKSAVHWDMVCDMRSGEIYADDELIYKDGKFIVNFE
ncbi:aminopeptidase [Candidatus Uabimicrobium amorphum]|uniref:Aminopeptidase n=1 Tax=Uabimicrobium amorphum TaxID=2596890 RepID=A0A5S9ISR6_UABAM|nr:aminopeptidase [Candidatus Uabimicrobium amorphum]BBM87419.1 aminopeptidase [Candidatus Uabimicrobium amorphum]